MRTGEARFWMLFLGATALAMETVSTLPMPDRLARPAGELIDHLVALAR